MSSPQLDYAVGGEVPALVPSALGSALSNFQSRNRNRHSVSSSSASSVSWSALTDEEDNLSVGVEDEYSNHPGGSDAQSSIYEGSSKASSIHHSIKSSASSALSYARRPSATNHRSTVPLLHRRTSSGSSSGLLGIPRSAPSLHLTDDDHYSGAGSDFRGEHDTYVSERERDQEQSTISSKPKRSRNRASLPAYFSLLQMSSPQRSPPISASVTSSHASPPTPKLALAAGHMISTSKVKTLMSVPGVPSTVEATPRGRRRDTETSRSSRRSESRSRSRSRKPSQLFRPNLQPELLPRGRMDSRSSVEKIFDWTLMPGAPRGRAAVRRNSSPLPKMLLSNTDFDKNSSVMAGSESRTRTRTRGRMAVDELEGMGFATEAPGYGIGRSGLLSRERVGPSRGAALGLR